MKKKKNRYFTKLCATYSILNLKKKKSDYFFRRYLACYNTYIKFNQK